MVTSFLKLPRGRVNARGREGCEVGGNVRDRCAYVVFMVGRGELDGFG